MNELLPFLIIALSGSMLLLSRPRSQERIERVTIDGRECLLVDTGTAWVCYDCNYAIRGDAATATAAIDAYRACVMRAGVPRWPRGDS